MRHPRNSRSGASPLIRLVGALIATITMASVATVPALAEDEVPADATAAPEQRLTFGLQAATETGLEARPVYTWTGTPGARVRDYVAVVNSSDQPVELDIYATDAVTTTDGQFALKTGAETATDAGAWISLPTAVVRVPARSEEILPFVVNIPVDAEPGDHAGAILLSRTAEQVQADGSALNVDQRVGIRTYVRVAGDVRPELAIENLNVSYDASYLPPWSGSATISYTLRNTGNIRLGALPASTVSGPFGTYVRGPDQEEIAQLLPGSSADVTLVVEDVPPWVFMGANVVVSPLATSDQDVQSTLLNIAVSKAFLAINWLLIAIATFIGTLVFWLIWRRFRRPPPKTQHRRHSASHAAHAASV